ncbi:MAG: TolC family protein [Terracidiphilus sp.]|jgi:outer membrane protein TolC
MTRLAFCAVLLFSICQAQQAQQPAAAPVLTLDEAIQTALKDNRQLQSAQLDVSKAQQATAEIGASRYPQFSADVLSGIALNPIHFTIPEGAIGDIPGIGPLPAENKDVTEPRRVTAIVHGSAVQPLTQLYKIDLGVRSSRIGEEFARQSLRQKRQELAEQVRDAYYQIVQAQGQVAAAEASLSALVELGGLTERRLAEETVLKSDLLSVKAKTSQQRLQLLTLRDGIATSKESFNRLLGRDLRTEFSVEPLPAPSVEELDLETARAKALEQRPEIREAKLQVEKAGLDIRRERAEYLPNLSVQLSYLSFANISFAPQNLTSAGFLFQWQPFDRGQKHHKIEELKSAAAQADLASTDAGQQVLIDVGAQYRKLAEARALLEAQMAVQESEREKLRVVMQRFEQKAVLMADVLQQQAALAEADSQLSQAVSGFWTAEAAFRRALGEE